MRRGNYCCCAETSGNYRWNRQAAFAATRTNKRIAEKPWKSLLVDPPYYNTIRHGKVPTENFGFRTSTGQKKTCFLCYLHSIYSWYCSLARILCCAETIVAVEPAETEPTGCGCGGAATAGEDLTLQRCVASASQCRHCLSV